jgi:hypothetical protein
MSTVSEFEYMYYTVRMCRVTCQNQITTRRAGSYLKPPAPDVPHRAHEERC